MNPKVRALLWAEFRVGAPLAAASILTALAAIFSMRFNAYGNKEIFCVGDITMGQYVLFFFGPVLLAGLLVLNRGNSGDLGGGFSRAVLQLPIDTVTAVMTTFLVRLALLAASGGIMIGLYHGLTGNSFGPGPVLLVLEIYLLVQVLDWLRMISAPITRLLGGLLAVVGILGIREIGQWILGNVLVSASGIFWVQLVLVSSLAIAGGYYFVAQARCQERFPASGRMISGDWAGAGLSREPFRSPLSAQCWMELRRTRFFLPKIFLALLAVGILFMVGLMQVKPGGMNFGESKSMWGVVAFLAFSTFSPLLLILSAILWNLRFGGWGFRSEGRCAIGIGAPVSVQETALARLAAALINLVITLSIITLLYLTAYFFIGGDLLVSLLKESLAQHESNLRELLMIVGVPIIVFGVGAWLLMMTPGMPWVMAAGLFGGVLLGINQSWIPSSARMPALCGACILWMAGILFMILKAWRIGRLSPGAAAVVLAGWLLLAAGFYPWTQSMSGENALSVACVCLAMAGGVVGLYPALLLFPREAGFWGDFQKKESSLKRSGEISSVGRRRPAGVLAGIAFLSLTLMWLRWPSEPAWKTLFREQGRPTDMRELNAWYAAVPENENIALKYYNVGPALSAAKKALTQEEDAHLAYVGQFSGVNRTGNIDPELWRFSRQYWRTAGQPIAAVLHEIAASGLTKSRYPVSVGIDMPSEHLNRVRDLAGVLALGGWVAAIEQRPEDAGSLVLDMLPLAQSLVEEPLVISQLIRIGVQNKACAVLEQILNRTAPAPAELLRLSEAFRKIQTPPAEGAFLNRGLVGEAVGYLSAFDAQSITRRWIGGSGILSLDRIIAVRFHESLFEKYRTPGQKDPVFADRFSDRAEKDRGLVCLAPMAAALLPTFGRSGEADLRGYTNIELALTALAIEGYRAEKGRLPQSLEELVPDFLPETPKDIWHPERMLSYTLRENGEYVVYSYGADNQDDQGAAPAKGQNWMDADITFTVAAPENRGAGVELS